MPNNQNVFIRPELEVYIQNTREKMRISARKWKAGQAYQRNPIDWSLVDSMHDHRMAECMQSYVCLVLISVRDKVMVAGVFHIRDKSRNL